MSLSLSPDDHPILSFLKEVLHNADAAPPVYPGLPEYLPKYEPGPDPVVPDRKVMHAIMHAVASTTGKAALRDAMNDLGDSAYSIEVCFTNATHGLAEALKESSTEDKPDIAQFKSDWETHQKTYTDLLQKSRKVAGHARTIALDFAEVFVNFLKVEDVSIQDKLERIQGYHKQLEEDIKNSEDLSQGFLDLQTSVAGFQGNLKVWLKAREQSEQQKQQIVKLVREIEAINDKIKELNSHIVKNAATTLSLKRVSVGALAVGILCPPVLVVAAGTAIAAGFSAKKGKDLHQTKAEVEAQLVSLEEQKAELEKLRDELSAPERVQNILHPLQSDIGLIRGKLGVFSKIWSCIHSDLVEIEQSMMMSTSLKVEPLFKIRLETMGQIYMVLCDALHQYETRVHTQPNFAVPKA